jgi:CheY-like chemotaxis protein
LRDVDRDSNPSVSSLSGAAKEHYNGLSILVAEDNKVNRNLLCRVLAKLGVPAENVSIAVDGEEACQVVFSRPEPLDVVFMDLSMPLVSGIEATREIRKLPVQRQPKTIVALTANAFEATRVECMAAGLDGFLTKPFRIHEIQAVLDTIALHLTNAGVSRGSSSATIEE